MADDQTVSRMLSTLYAAPSAPERWMGFLRDTCEVIEARNAVLIEHDAASQAHRGICSLGSRISPRADVYANNIGNLKGGIAAAYLDWVRGAVLIGAEVWPKGGEERR